MDKTDKVLNQLRTGSQQAEIKRAENVRVDTSQILQQLQPERRLPIAEDMFIPNLSGDLSHGHVSGVKLTALTALSGNGAPATTPTGIGLIYIDTLNGVMYISMGTTSSADWKGVLTA